MFIVMPSRSWRRPCGLQPGVAPAAEVGAGATNQRNLSGRQRHETSSVRRRTLSRNLGQDSLGRQPGAQRQRAARAGGRFRPGGCHDAKKMFCVPHCTHWLGYLIRLDIILFSEQVSPPPAHSRPGSRPPTRENSPCPTSGSSNSARTPPPKRWKRSFDMSGAVAAAADMRSQQQPKTEPDAQQPLPMVKHYFLLLLL